MKSKIFPNIYRIHAWLGLFVALHFLVLAITGSVLLFKDSFAGEEEGPVNGTQSYVETAVILQKALNEFPRDRAIAVFVDEDHENILHLRLGIDHSREFKGARRLSYDRVSGEKISGQLHQENPFFHWVLELHRDLLLGPNGKLYVGFIGLLYVLVMISGFFIYGNFARKKNFAEIRLQTARTRSSDLHRSLGMLVMGWGVLIGVTGAFLGFSSLLIKLYEYEELKHLLHDTSRPAVNATVGDMSLALSKAQALLPESEFSYLVFPDTSFSPPGSFLILMKGKSAATQRLVQLVSAGAPDGAAEVHKLPWYLKASMLSEPLHFGDYGGWWLKSGWLLLSLISVLLPILGIRVWWLRRNHAVEEKTKEKNLIPFKGSWARKSYWIPTLVTGLSLGLLLTTFFLGGTVLKILSLLLWVPGLVGARLIWGVWKGHGSK
jgi:uncharacterized iron-regulated membrane protein